MPARTGCTHAGPGVWLIYVPVHFRFPKSLPSQTTIVPGSFRRTQLSQTSACFGPFLKFLVCLSPCACAVVYIFSPGVCVSSYRSQLPVIYLCITLTVQVLLAGRLSSTGPHHPDIWSCWISVSQLCLQSKHTCILLCLVPGLPWCVCGCFKGQVSALTLAFPGHLSFFKALYSAVLLLKPLLL